MEEYDVVVVGAGPAGGQAARELAQKGCKVLLAERNEDFTVNSYSSAGAPEELMSRFSLPEEVVGSGWDTIRMYSNNNESAWQSGTRGGVVMDFAKLRRFLADEAFRHGAKVLLGTSFVSRENNRIHFTVGKEKINYTVSAKTIIDATGGERRVLGRKGSSFPSTGIEHLVEVDDKTYAKWANTLSIFMGSDWMPQGYAWIFPMEPGLLKVGVGRYFSNQMLYPQERSYQFYLDKIKSKCLNLNDLKTKDIHGKTIRYTPGRNDCHFDGNAVAIGDAISMINPLAFEGIRHAMESGRIAAKHVERYLKAEEKNFSPFEKEIGSYCGIKWRVCEFLMNRIYREPQDRNIDHMIECFKAFSFNEMIDLSFHYDLSKAARFYASFLAKKYIRFL